MELYYCASCGARVPEEDVLSGAATVEIVENRVLCKECTQAGVGDANVHDAATGTDFRPVEDAVIPQTLSVKSARRSSRSLIATVHPSNASQRVPPRPPSKAPIIGLLIGGIMLCVAILIFILKPGAKPKKTFGDEPDTQVTAIATHVTTAARTGVTAAVGTGTDATVATQAIQLSPYRWVPVSVVIVDDADSTRSDVDMRWLALTWPFLPDKRPPPVPYATQFVSTGTQPIMPAGGNDFVLAKLSVDTFKGGRVVKNFDLKPKDARVINPKAPEASMAARFDLKLPTHGPASILVEACRTSATPCAIAVVLNGHELFHGPDPSTVSNAWSVETFSVPDGIIQPGRNELRFSNTEPASAASSQTFALTQVEIRGIEPTAPAVFPEPSKPPPVPPTK